MDNSFALVELVKVLDRLAAANERVAKAQERMLEIAEDARNTRKNMESKLSDAMKNYAKIPPQA